jgi:hypothetical protein
MATPKRLLIVSSSNRAPVRPDRMTRLFRLGTPWPGTSKSGSVSGTISFPVVGRPVLRIMELLT